MRDREGPGARAGGRVIGHWWERQWWNWKEVQRSKDWIVRSELGGRRYLLHSRKYVCMYISEALDGGRENGGGERARKFRDGGATVILGDLRDFWGTWGSDPKGERRDLARMAPATAPRADARHVDGGVPRREAHHEQQAADRARQVYTFVFRVRGSWLGGRRPVREQLRRESWVLRCRGSVPGAPCSVLARARRAPTSLSLTR